MGKKSKCIIIFGPPGVGKGTQAKLLADREDYFHFSTGEMFRNIDVNTELGRKVKGLMDNGILIPEDILIELFDNTINDIVRNKKFNPEKQVLLLDGIPRTVNQVKLINERFNVLLVIYFNAPDEVLIKRLTGRAKLEGRAEDKDENIIEKRIDIYRKTTMPVLEKYDKKIIREVDASGTVEEIYQGMINALSELR